MIGSFWNLCRACPSMPIDKLHSEYRSTYTWHEYTGPHQEHTVVRRSPQPAPASTKQANAKLQSAKSTEDDNSEGTTLEPALPRRKKCPELAYKSHEFMMAADGGGIDAIDSNVIADKTQAATAAPVLPTSQLSKAISRISTEYRLQFAWPRRSQLTNGEASSGAGIAAAGGGGSSTGGGLGPGTAAPPRKSLSMGALKQGIAPSAPAPVHKKRSTDLDRKRDGVQASELEPLVGSNGIDAVDGVVLEGEEQDDELAQPKVTFRSVTKEEKEQENTRKIGPAVQATSMPPAGRPSTVQVRPSSVQARPAYSLLQDDAKTDNERAIARARKDFLIRHHLDRTTGVGDGALLPSPTREKLEPVVPRRRDEPKETRDEIQPRAKSSPKNSPRAGRSQSLGPTVAERRSPKRQPVRAPSVTKDSKDKGKEPKDKEKEPSDRAAEPARHPRPMTAEPQTNGHASVIGESDGTDIPSGQPGGPLHGASPWLDDEPVVKSPPEPTRVKSPEQMIMRSPEPVNWTVPLDTGKTFTVTQNVREGEPLTRPHSEAKTWGASSMPSVPQSASPDLAAHHYKSQHSQHSGYKSPESESVSLGSFSGLNGHKDQDSERESPLPAAIRPQTTTPTSSLQHNNDKLPGSDLHRDEIAPVAAAAAPEPREERSEVAAKPVVGTNLRCLDDPVFEFERKKEATAPSSGYRILEAEVPRGVQNLPQVPASGGYHVLEAPTVGAQGTPAQPHSTTNDVLETARNRFDKFWGKGSENQN